MMNFLSFGSQFWLILHFWIQWGPGSETLIEQNAVHNNISLFFHSEDEWVPAQPAAPKEKTLKVKRKSTKWSNP
jgi:hypothetical protein